tara:strand:- start:3547 stop:3771 length:225 start_codon:yes stop_codon:yes gene_type:complete
MHVPKPYTYIAPSPPKKMTYLHDYEDFVQQDFVQQSPSVKNQLSKLFSTSSNFSNFSTSSFSIQTYQTYLILIE